MKAIKRNSYLLIIGLIFLFSCRTAEYHEKKFYQKGGTFICKNDTISIHDTVIDSLGNEVIIVRDSIVSVPVISYVPKYVYRYKYLERKSELKAQTKHAKSTNKKEVKINRTNKKAQTKQVKQVEKTKRWSWWTWLIIGFIIGISWKAVYQIVKRYVKAVV
mgnify:CR=1 FL=1